MKTTIALALILLMGLSAKLKDRPTAAHRSFITEVKGQWQQFEASLAALPGQPHRTGR